ncbi:PAP2-domain-containing protein [Lichtheimia hyalospora FSU 10163]|nr:PAP2-domain-containing protein [Lichtheimia hyalospora FSU 10163]
MIQHDDTVMLASLSLTHVQFDAQDKIAYAFAYITLLPLAILVFYASVIVSRREIAGILMLLGQLTNEALNAILKEYLQMARPHSHLGTGYGMPSSHAQFMAFFAVYGSLYLWSCIHLDHIIYKVLATLGMIFLSLLVCYSRIYLQYHSAMQVAAGMGVGTLYGILWFCILEFIFRPSGIINYLLDTWLAKLIYLRDMRAIDNVAQWEYNQWLQQRQNSSKSKTK